MERVPCASITPPFSKLEVMGEALPTVEAAQQDVGECRENSSEILRLIDRCRRSCTSPSAWPTLVWSGLPSNSKSPHPNPPPADARRGGKRRLLLPLLPQGGGGSGWGLFELSGNAL